MDLVSQGTELALEMARRDKERAAIMEQINPPSRPRLEMKALAPGTLGTMGSLMDAAGTYAGIKFKRGRESNPLINMIANQNPELTAVAAFGSRPLMDLLGRVIGKISPGAADAVAANLGAEQAILGSNWLRRIAGQKPGRGFDNYKNAFDRWGMERSRRSK